MTSPDGAARRAARLLRWYPKAWRSRYGEEFAELLIAEISERPRSLTRTADVMRGGIVARLTAAGLCGCTLEASAQVRASLVSLAWCVAIFADLAAAMWSQLTIGWQWSEPDTAATTVAVMMMSAAMLAFLGLAAAATVPVLWSAGSRLARGRPPGLLGPAALVVACAMAARRPTAAHLPAEADTECQTPRLELNSRSQGGHCRAPGYGSEA